MMSPIYTALWPALALLLVVSGIVCVVAKRRAFGAGLLISGGVLLGSWQYDRTHEKVTKFNVALLGNKLIQENGEHPEESVFYVQVTALEMGQWEGKLRARDIHVTNPPGSIVTVEIAERPLTGSYLKSMTSLDYGKPPPRYTYVPPPTGEEFEYVFGRATPPSVTLSNVICTNDATSARIVLIFHTDHATFDQLRPTNFEDIPFDFFSLSRTATNELHWRSPTRSTQIWGRNARDGRDYQRNPEDHFDNDRAFMSWDDDGLVQYAWVGRGLRTDR